MTTLDKMLQGLANALGASLSTLTTTAKTVVGAINELKSGLTSTNTTVSGHTSTIGSGALDTTSQTLIGAVNELAAKNYVTGYFRKASPGSSATIATFTAQKSGTFILIAGISNIERITVTGPTMSMSDNVMGSSSDNWEYLGYGTITSGTTVTITGGYDWGNSLVSGVYFII